MKVKTDFVTNSSSTCFVCEICGSTEGGMDVCLSDVDMVECENGHTFCLEHIDQEDHETIIQDIIEKEGLVDENTNSFSNFVYRNDLDYAFPEKYCPICNLDHILPETIIDYLFKKYNLNSQEVMNEIRREHKK